MGSPLVVSGLWGLEHIEHTLQQLAGRLKVRSLAPAAALIEASPVGMLLTDNDGYISFANPAAQAIINLSVRALLVRRESDDGLICGTAAVWDLLWRQPVPLWHLSRSPRRVRPHGEAWLTSEVV